MEMLQALLSLLFLRQHRPDTTEDTDIPLSKEKSCDFGGTSGGGVWMLAPPPKKPSWASP